MRRELAVFRLSRREQGLSRGLAAIADAVNFTLGMGGGVQIDAKLGQSRSGEQGYEAG